jgi:hypothetical protein
MVRFGAVGSLYETPRMFTTRRDFLRSGALAMVALPTWAMPAGLELARPTDAALRSGRIQFEPILIDARRSQALEFGAAARELGGRTLPISGEMDDPCYAELRRRWRATPRPVAGITDFRTLSLLQLMALDAGMRPILCIHHGGHAESLVHNVYRANACGAAAAWHLPRAGTLWPVAAARLLLCLRAGDAPSTRGGLNAAGKLTEVGELHALDSRALVTWAIA